MIASLNTFLRFAKWDDCCVKQYKVQRTIYYLEEKELTKEEYYRLVKTAQRDNYRMSLIIQTICGTGIRVSEMQYITVEAAKKGEATVNCKGKTRVILITNNLKKRLLEYARKNGITTGVIFRTRNGKVISRCNIWRDMKALCKKSRC
jgi:integrase